MKKFETVAPKVVRQMRDGQLTITQAVRQYLELMATKRSRTVLAPLHEIDFDREMPAFAAWVEQSLANGAMPDSIAGVWFYVPEFMMNEPKVYFVGSKEFSLEDADWASATDWTQDATGRGGRATPSDHPPEFDSAVLREVLAAIGCDESDESRFEQDEQLGEEVFFTTTGLAQVYVGCLLHVALPKIAPSLACGGRAWRGVGYGLASGDLQYAGVLGASGWLDKTRAKRVTAKEPDGEFYLLLSTWNWSVHSLFDGAWVDFPEAADYDAIRGFRLPRRSPLPALPPVRTIAMRSETPRATTDFAHSFATPPVITSRFRKVLEAFNSQIVWYPVDLTHKGKPVEGEYWVMAIRPSLSFHDENASKRTSPTDSDTDGLGMLLSTVVDPDKVPADVHVFSHSERPDVLYVRGHVLKELRRNKIKGFEANKVRVLNRDNTAYDASRPASRPFGLLTASEPEANQLRTDVNPTKSHPEREFFTISNWQWRVHCLHHADLPTLEAIRGFRPFAGNTPPPPLPMPMSFCLESNSREPHGDFATSSLVPPVVSARFRQVLDSFTREITWYPVDLMHDGLKLDGEFWAMAIRPLLSFHNEVHTTRAGPRATDLLLGIVMDSWKVPLHLDVFAHVERPEQLFVSDAVVEALRSSGVTGFEATPVRAISNSRSNR